MCFSGAKELWFSLTLDLRFEEYVLSYNNMRASIRCIFPYHNIMLQIIGTGQVSLRVDP